MLHRRSNCFHRGDVWSIMRCGCQQSCYDVFLSLDEVSGYTPASQLCQSTNHGPACNGPAVTEYCNSALAGLPA